MINFGYSNCFEFYMFFIAYSTESLCPKVFKPRKWNKSGKVSVKSWKFLDTREKVFSSWLPARWALERRAQKVRSTFLLLEKMHLRAIKWSRVFTIFFFICVKQISILSFWSHFSCTCILNTTTEWKCWNNKLPSIDFKKHLLFTC